MAKKAIEVEEIIKNLNQEYSNDILNSFIEHGRFDYVLGYAILKKGAIINSEGKICFMKQNESLSGKVSKVMYRDSQTDKIAAIYNEEIKKSNVQPNFEWATAASRYATDSYRALVKKYENIVLKECKDWDCIAFARRVPCATIALFEDKIIQAKNSLKILAFAQEVKGANIQKLGVALKNIGNTHYEEVEYKLNGKTNVERVIIDHIRVFEDKFGKIPEESEK